MKTYVVVVFSMEFSHWERKVKFHVGARKWDSIEAETVSASAGCTQTSPHMDAQKIPLQYKMDLKSLQIDNLWKTLKQNKMKYSFLTDQCDGAFIFLYYNENFETPMKQDCVEYKS